ncbi:MAG: hypothetical protein OEW62_10720 [Candidatus Bathyarchaeota archaeon]|nr:hypothetical protein [Candidatus Bathyarchaeota archaeon]MDH5595513.1 hypothetical protein [Candidatus Bathyarchaeota archaeon]
MEVKIVPTKKIIVLGVDKRSLENLAWCATTYGINRLLWVDGYLLCVEVYEKSFEHEIKRKAFPISQVCYTSFPKYTKVFEVQKGVRIPIVNASDMQIYRNLLKAILKGQ